MRLLNFVIPEDTRTLHLGAIVNDHVVDLHSARSWAQGAHGIPAEGLPQNLIEFIHSGGDGLVYIRKLLEVLKGEDILHLKSAHRAKVGYIPRNIFVYPPLLHPMTLRDFYAFEQHVKSAYEIRRQQVPDEWYQFPVFYYSNTNAIFGPYSTIPYPGYTHKLDYELEIACIIGRMGRDISVDKAEEHILGYTIFNDWSARDIQRSEMKVGLGPAKSKDFASSLGPYLVTPDELDDRRMGPGIYDLEMVARVNGSEKSRGNWKDIHYPFGELIARASADTMLYAGDVLGSGTVGTGCLLEITKGEGPWLEPGDRVELEIERLGILSNVIGQRKEIK